MSTMLREFIYRKLTHLNVRRWHECVTLIDWLEPSRGEVVLDVGCGDGWWSRRITENGARVVGVDINERRLAIARKRNADTGNEYHAMDAENLAFPDRTFDKAISMCVIEHFHNEDAVLRSMARVTKPGGVFVLSADSLTNPELTPAERDDHRKRFAVNTFYTIDLLREKLDRAGFDLEHAEYILTSPITLALVRISWKVDDLYDSKVPIKEAFADVASFWLDTVGAAIIRAAEKFTTRKDSGLTILARARRRAD